MTKKNLEKWNVLPLDCANYSSSHTGTTNSHDTLSSIKIHTTTRALSQQALEIQCEHTK